MYKSTLETVTAKFDISLFVTNTKIILLVFAFARENLQKK